MDAYEALTSRRSVPRVTEPAPSREQISRILDAAVRAPNHFITEPWRFIVLEGDALEGLGDAWARAAEREGADPEAARTKARRAPLILCMIGRPKIDHSKVVEVEEHHAIGAAIQNILLAAHSMGVGAMIRTGPAANYSEVRDFLGVGTGEYIAALIYMGTPAIDLSERPLTRRTPAEERTEWRS